MLCYVMFFLSYIMFRYVILGYLMLCYFIICYVMLSKWWWECKFVIRAKTLPASSEWFAKRVRRANKLRVFLAQRNLGRILNSNFQIVRLVYYAGLHALLGIRNTSLVREFLTNQLTIFKY